MAFTRYSDIAFSQHVKVHGNKNNLGMDVKINVPYFTFKKITFIVHCRGPLHTFAHS